MLRPKNLELLRLPIVLFAVALLAIPTHLRPDNFIVDDGYFYPEIARHIVLGQGSTFNGLTPTNGYHPLWMLICVACTWIGRSPGIIMQILLSIQDLMTLAIVAVVMLIARQSGKRGALIGLAPIVFYAMVLGIWRLLEANLALLLQVAVLVVLLPVLPPVSPAPGQKIRGLRNLVLGALLGLTLLARLDLAFFVLTVIAFQLPFHGDARGVEGETSLPALLLQGMVAALLLAPYLAWNFLRFHHLMPISGAIKSTFPYPQTFHGFQPFVWPVVLGILCNLRLIFITKRSPFERLSLITAIAALLHLAYSLAFGSPGPWYLTTGYLSFTFAIIWILDAILTGLQIPRWIEGASALGIFLVFATLASLRLFSNFSYARLTTGKVSLSKHYEEPKKMLGEELDRRLASGTRVFVFDAPGGVAWHSNMSIIPADGLVADYTYNSDLDREGFALYSAEHNIKYFIAPILHDGQVYDRLYMTGHRVAGGQQMEIESPLHQKDVGSVLLRDDRLLFTSRETNPSLEATMPEVGIWQINPAAR